ncbi:hypothetical protein [Glaesserella sp.]|uniref:hypothetical protein n=1 Tax=Glaesserella sp. TaxID=2094731 RepID=UPI0035A1C4B8
MKHVKFTATALAALILAACSQTSTPVESVPQATVQETVPANVQVNEQKLATTAKSVAYFCDGNLVSAAYTFDGQNARAAAVRVGENLVTDTLVRDVTNTDFASFVSANYVWNVEPSLTLDTFDKAKAVMLTRKGGNSDVVLVKNCKIRSAATAKLNQ